MISKRRISFLLFLLIIVCYDCKRPQDHKVVVYTSVDRNHSEPVFKEFERRTNVKVEAVYDAEANKSAGLANRLIAERNNPRADVFWSGEPLHILNLKKKGILEHHKSLSNLDVSEHFKDSEMFWAGFSGRLRVIIYNKDLVSPEDVPKSINDLINSKYRNKFAVANPLFGTTTFHFVSFFLTMGENEAIKYITKLKANGARIVDGNSVVRKLVELGEIEMGLTDSDDADLSLSSGKNIGIVYPDNDAIGTLFIPNMVALIKKGPNTGNGKLFIDYLLSNDAEKLLFSTGWLKISVREVFENEKNHNIKLFVIDYEKAASILPDALSRIKNIFEL